MQLAIVWLCQGTFILGLIHCVRGLADRWRATLDRVMLYPGPIAVATWIALQSIAVFVALLTAGLGLALLGLTTIASIFITIASLGGLTAGCATGLLLPHLGIEYHSTSEAL